MNKQYVKYSCLFFIFGMAPGADQLASADELASARIQNILYIIADDLKASALPVYGDKICKSPNIDRLARRGMVFNHAHCQGVVCAPSRPSLMFSRYGKQNVKLITTEGKLKSFPQFFRDKGWYTARVSKIYHMAVPRDIVGGTDGADHAPSWTERFNCQGMEESSVGAYASLSQNIFKTDLADREGAGTKHRMFVRVKTPNDGAEQPDHKAAAKAIELLQKHKDEPFVLAVGFVRPHYPMVAPEDDFRRYDYKKIKLPELRDGDWDDIPEKSIAKSTSQSNGLAKYPENQKRMWTSYYASVSFMDRQLGKILDELDRLGLADKTAIVFTSDHGYHLGEHDFWQKSNLHEEVTRVPMIILAPGYKPGRSDSLVELADIYPTVVSLAGLKPPAECHGVSLIPVLENPSATVRDFAYSFHNKGHAVRGKRWVYITYGNDSEELYDMNTDPGQFTNLANDPEYATQLLICKKVLAEKLAKHQT